MKNDGLKNEQFISELTISGSTAIKTKNDAGVHIFSGSVYDAGVISSTLVKPKYNQKEIIKSLDTNIIELIPINPPELEDTVLRSIYNQALAQIDALTLEVSTLNGVILSLESKITEVEIVSQSLRVELDNDKILIASLQNQNQQSTLRIQSSIVDLQNSIQRATSEAIQRTSLTARNESLLQEIESLRAELNATRERLEQTVRDFILETSISSELERGGVRIGDITVTPNITDDLQPAITWRGAKPGNGYKDAAFINGGVITIFNPTESNITVRISQSEFTGSARGKSSEVFSNIPQSITVSAGGKSTVRLKVNTDKVDVFKTGVSGDSFAEGRVIFTTDVATNSIPAEIQIQRGGKYKRPS
jgi:hypothetical protein